MRPIRERFAYIWADGIYWASGDEQEHSCLLVVVGARDDGRKELLAIELGYRESANSWADVLRSLRDRGLGAPLWRSGTGRSGSGRPCATCSPRRATSAAGTTAR